MDTSSPFRFRPAWWLPGAHAQTIGGRWLRRYDPDPPRTERVELPDGDFLDLHEGPERLPDDAPIVLVLHGLEGSWRSNYMSTLARELARLGIRAVRMNFRACSGEMNRLARFYHAGDTDDLDFVARMLAERHPGVPMGAVGFSLGGNVLLKYLGERGACGERGELGERGERDERGERGDGAVEPIRCAVAISVPFDLVAGTRRLEDGIMSRVYTRYFIQKLRRKAIAKREILRDLCDVDAAIASRTIRGYDDALTARLHGFADAWDYYESSSSRHWLGEIRIPTLILHSLDDPFLPAESVPLEAIRANPCLVEGISDRGGHVGFVAGSPWRPVFWVERVAAGWLAEVLGERGDEGTRGR